MNDQSSNVTWQVGIRLPFQIREFYQEMAEDLRTSNSGLLANMLQVLFENPELLQAVIEHSQPRPKYSRHWNNRKRDKPKSLEITAETRIPYPPHKSAGVTERKVWVAEKSQILLERARKAWRYPGDYLIEEAQEAVERWKAATPAAERPVRPFRESRAARSATIQQWLRERLELCRAVEELSPPPERGLRKYHWERARNRLRQFDERIRLDSRPLLKHYFEYLADCAAGHFQTEAAE